MALTQREALEILYAGAADYALPEENADYIEAHFILSHALDRLDIFDSVDQVQNLIDDQNKTNP